jgi:glycosyltransferase involved in cell wall biosynthesis
MPARATAAGANVVNLQGTAAAPNHQRRSGERSHDAQTRMGSAPALRVVMMGPALSVKGGISSVERIILNHLPSTVAATHIATMEDGGKLRKAVRYVRALMRARTSFATRPDLVHVHFASRASSVRKMFLASLALDRGVPVLMHAHGGYYQDYWREMKRGERARAQRVLASVQGLIVLGKVWRDFFSSIGVPSGRICVLPNPVAIPAEVPVRVDNSVVRAVYLGLMSEAKGTFDLIEAVSGLPPLTRSRLRLVLAGNGETARARTLIAQKGLANCIEVRDWVDAEQRDQLLAESQLFMLPSYREGLPMSMLEAMAWGLTPICSPVGSVGEVITHGHNGVLVPAGNIGALTHAIAELLSDDRKRASIGASARSSVEPLSVDRYLDRLVAVYAAAAQGGSIAELSVECKR